MRMIETIDHVDFIGCLVIRVVSSRRLHNRPELHPLNDKRSRSIGGESLSTKMESFQGFQGFLAGDAQ